nr:MupA/Atu3671 family FMN-dependent luciferase-like monooxygenase [Paenibacillus periandrae]
MHTLKFSVFFFSCYQDYNRENKYDIIMRLSRFADENGFEAVWFPERHFHDFGGLFPNPSVIAAAIAATTKNINIRSGSVVSPLHNVIRIAEEWAVVDNLSKGRVGLSFAPGWHPNDFVLYPERYQERKKIMFDQIKVIANLWRGDSIETVNGAGEQIKISVYPQPIQTDLPIWITTSGNKESYKSAARIGANILTHMIGQNLKTLQENITIYREELEKSGYSPYEKTISVMMHTFIGEDRELVKGIVKEPFTNYLRTSTSLWNNMDRSTLQDHKVMNKLCEVKFRQHWETAALFGTIDSCENLIKDLKGAGVNEIAFLLDFGVPDSLLFDELEPLLQLKQRFAVEE